jgi:16S rRNA C967 or C1407 C5-methylase (RsmB/RsmF family)/NOL1/NOP2/fmu family ribosome biogenesis protein
MDLPDQFLQRMKSILGDDYIPFLESYNQGPPTSIRVNPEKIEGKPELIHVDYCSSGYFLNQRPVFTLDPFLHSGVYYVQEASSMFLEQALTQTKTSEFQNILDLCASPGGKSTHIASLISSDSLLVSNEVIRQRAVILSENIKKWGIVNIIVTNNDPKDFASLESFFDVLVVDAPCSGEGLFRRDENSVAEWSVSNAQLCSQRQKRILADVWPSLKNGGILIYSTCTYNPVENEENIKWLKKFASVEPIKLNIDHNWGIIRTDADGIPCYRFYPHKVKGEGFFISVLRKKGGNSIHKVQRNTKNQLLASKSEKESVNKLIRNKNLEILRFENSLLAFPSHQLAQLFQIKNSLRIIHAGVKIGELKQNDLIPSHELALSNILNQNAFPNLDLTIEQALSYLKREEIQLPFQYKGWNLLSYRDIPLGLVKNLGTRNNSLFPKEWRIRMSISEFHGERLGNEMSKFPL